MEHGLHLDVFQHDLVQAQVRGAVFGAAFNTDERFWAPSGISTTGWPPDQVKEDSSGLLFQSVHTSIPTPMRVAASKVSEEGGKVRLPKDPR